jgi:hypothetical protein
MNNLHNSDGFNTNEVLEFIYLSFLNNGTGLIDRQAEKYLSFLLAKFEATGKLFEEYSYGAEKGIGNFEIIINYVLLAVNLLLYYGLNKELKVLNTILKINDMLDILANRNLIKTDTIPLLIYSLCSEMREMENLYEAKRFRLPAY